jgi:hypothetical protein
MKILFMSLIMILSFNLLANNDSAHPCKDDIKKYCLYIPKKPKEILACLKKHENILSVMCKEKLAETKKLVKEKMDSIRQNCTEDFNKFCSDVKPGKGARFKCLKDHKNDVSINCQSVL